MELIDAFQDKLILDCGAGYRDTFHANVINYEIVDYPSTDVLGIGEKLPFKSGSLDAVMSFAVLEHVRDPFACAREIIRVLKPGGTLYITVPFLQPFHGYPDHYYNMTSSGLKNLFARDLEILDCGVPFYGVPIISLNWFLKSYVKGLPPEAADHFKSLKIGELLGGIDALLTQDYNKALSPAVIEELASVNYLVARKPDR